MSIEHDVIQLVTERVRPTPTEPVDRYMQLSSELDDLDFVDLLVAIDEKFGITIPDEDGEKLETVDELIRYVQYAKKPSIGKPLFTYKTHRRTPEFDLVGCMEESTTQVGWNVSLLIVVGALTGTPILYQLSIPITIAVIAIALVAASCVYLERKKLMSEINENERPISINISGQVGNVNLGSVHGDLNASLNTLVEKGGDELALSIKELTESIIGSELLNQAEKQETIEQVDELARQAALPTEERKAGIINSIISSIDSTLQTAEVIFPLWQRAQTIFRQVFGF